MLNKYSSDINTDGVTNLGLTENQEKINLQWLLLQSLESLILPLTMNK